MRKISREIKSPSITALHNKKAIIKQLLAFSNQDFQNQTIFKLVKIMPCRLYNTYSKNEGFCSDKTWKNIPKEDCSDFEKTRDDTVTSTF